ncbi:MAG: hypothetical protein ACMXYF_00490 [Candidatus Woesearchaeota archaeon]
MDSNMIALILAVFAGTLGAIVYVLRVLVLLERRIARIDTHIEALVKTVLKEELKIEKQEKKLEKLLTKKK